MEGKMNLRTMGWSGTALLALALGAAPAARAQSLTWMFDAGLAVPVGTFDDYFEAGATASAEVAYPLQDRVDLTFGVDWDHYNSHAFYGTPNLNQWRFQVGLLADLLGRREDGFTIEGRLRGGASSMASQDDFWREEGTLGVDLERDRVSFSKKGMAGSAGLRFRFGGDSRLNGFLGISGNWAQLGTDATQVLRDAEPDALGELSSAVSYSISAGFSFGP
jgi:hypothetical protein